MKRYAVKVDVKFTKEGDYNATNEFTFTEVIPLGKNPVHYVRDRINSELERVEKFSSLSEELLAIENKSQDGDV